MKAKALSLECMNKWTCNPSFFRKLFRVKVNQGVGMKYQVLGLILIASMTMGFSFGAKKEKNTSTSSAAAAKTQAAVDQAGQSVKKAVDNYGSKTTASSAPAPKASANQPTAASEEFPTELVSQLAAGDEATRKARMESLRRLSQALGQMNAPPATQTNTNSKKKN